jgi:hypothetical protein
MPDNEYFSAELMTRSFLSSNKPVIIFLPPPHLQTLQASTNLKCNPFLLGSFHAYD